MAYIDRTHDARGRSTAIAGVIVIHAALGFVLVTGLAQHFTKPVPPPPLVGGQIDLPPPPPDPTPTPTPTSAVRPTDPIAPFPPIDIGKPPPFNLDPIERTDPIDIGPYLDPTPTPSPLPSFTPRGAAPRNDPGAWVVPDDYPPAEIRMEHEGVAVFRVVVGSNGKASDCEITRSSGYPRLDEATCRNVMRRARFEPATDQNGKAVVGTYSNKVRWVLPRR